MLRYLLLFVLAAVTPLAAQTALTADMDIDQALELMMPRDNSVSIGLRLVRGAKVTFKNLGSVATTRTIGNATDETLRTYDDGSVGFDTRSFTNGSSLPDDGKTNNWNYMNASQVTEDESGIAFHTYSSTTDGAYVNADSGIKGGADVEYSRRFGVLGRRNPKSPSTVSWGGTIGMAMTDVNVRNQSTVYTTLNTVTDVYSLLGFAVPDAPYSAPSTSNDTITNSDGTTTSINLDTTTFLANRPDSRTETSTENAAVVHGFWQVKGGALTLRAGPWLRWQPTDRLALRLSAGGTVSLLGLYMRYDERLIVDEILSLIMDQDESDTRHYVLSGFYGTADAELTVTPRTGFYAGASYDKTNHPVTLSVGGRAADVELSNGFGVRLGVTTRF